MHFLRFKPDIRCERRVSRTLLLDFLPLILLITYYIIQTRKPRHSFCSLLFYVFSIDLCCFFLLCILHLRRPLAKIVERRPLSSPHNWMAIAHCHWRRRAVRTACMHFFFFFFPCAFSSALYFLRHYLLTHLTHSFSNCALVLFFSIHSQTAMTNSSWLENFFIHVFFSLLLYILSCYFSSFFFDFLFFLFQPATTINLRCACCVRAHVRCELDIWTRALLLIVFRASHN